jgi:hypothetical protein
MNRKRIQAPAAPINKRKSMAQINNEVLQVYRVLINNKVIETPNKGIRTPINNNRGLHISN